MLEEEENPKGLEIEHKICDTSRMKETNNNNLQHNHSVTQLRHHRH